MQTTVLYRYHIDTCHTFLKTARSRVSIHVVPLLVVIEGNSCDIKTSVSAATSTRSTVSFTCSVFNNHKETLELMSGNAAKKLVFL